MSQIFIRAYNKTLYGLAKQMSHRLPITPLIKSKKEGICTLLCHQQVVHFLYCLSSFFYFARMKLHVTVVDDGSLVDKDYYTLRHFFPGITILSSNYAKNETNKKIKKYKYCFRYRNECAYSMYAHNKKLFDPILLSGYEKFILLDADILFLRRPFSIVRWINSHHQTTLYMKYRKTYIDSHNLVNTTTQRALFRLYGITINPYFNSGIICSYKRFFNLQAINRLLSVLYDLSISSLWFGEQMAFSENYCSPKSYKPKSCALPDAYALYEPNELKYKDKHYACIHYHGRNKQKMLYDALGLFIKHGWFRLP